MDQLGAANAGYFNPLEHENLLNGNSNPALDDSDTIFGSDGDDTLRGGKAADWLYGEDGNDSLYGGDGGDALHGGSGSDRLHGNDGDDWLDGGSGNDRLFGGDGIDLLLGDDGDDALYGNTGNDELVGGSGDDQLDGGPGRDLLRGGSGRDTLAGGTGGDVFTWSSRDYDGSDLVVDFNRCQDVLRLEGLLPEGGDSAQLLSRITLSIEGPLTSLIIFQTDGLQEMHRIELFNANLLVDGLSSDQVLRQMHEQNLLQFS
jgi:Ca2+-binding RTX toxin-like protein